MRRMMRIIDTFETAQAIWCAQKIPARWKILVPIDAAIYYELDSILRDARLGTSARGLYEAVN